VEEKLALGTDILGLEPMQDWISHERSPFISKPVGACNLLQIGGVGVQQTLSGRLQPIATLAFECMQRLSVGSGYMRKRAS
jgi:hypothetical protein